MNTTADRNQNPFCFVFCHQVSGFSTSTVSVLEIITGFSIYLYAVSIFIFVTILVTSSVTKMVSPF